MKPPRRLRRILARIGLALLVVALAIGAVAFALVRKFYPSPPAPSFAAPKDDAEAREQDLAYLANDFELDKSFTPDARARAEQLLAETRAKASSLTTAEMDLAIGRIVALADNGHSRLNPLSVAQRHGRLPCRLYRFADGYAVVRARPPCAPLLGAQVTYIEGRPAAEVADAMYSAFGGPKNHYDQFASVFFLESPELLHAAGLAASPRQVTWRVTLRDASTREVVVVADPPDPDAPRSYSDEYLSPLRIEHESNDWAPLLAAGAELPLFLRDYSDPFHAEYFADDAMYYAQFRSNADEPGHPIGPFVARVRREIEARRPSYVVLDLRLDQGGNFTKTASLMEDLTHLADSIVRVYVLTSAWTFSAGLVDVALAKEQGGDKVVVVGEPVGDRLRFWAEGGRMVLPNSKLSIGFATGLHDYTQPCTGQDGCFWILRFYPLHVPTLAPDVPVHYTYDDYLHLLDPMLDRARALAREHRGR